MEHFSADELRTATGDVRGVALVAAVRGGSAGAPAAGPGAGAAARPAACRRQAHREQDR